MMTFTPSYEQFLIGSDDSPALQINTRCFHGLLAEKAEALQAEVLHPMETRAKESHYPGQPVK